MFEITAGNCTYTLPIPKIVSACDSRDNEMHLQGHNMFTWKDVEGPHQLRTRANEKCSAGLSFMLRALKSWAL